MIDGYVWDMDSRTIADANIKNLATGQTVTSNADGYFKINASPNDQLRFSHAAYEPVTILAKNFTSYIELPYTTLDEVEVTAPGGGTKPQKSASMLLWLLVPVIAIGGYKLLKNNPKKVRI